MRGLAVLLALAVAGCDLSPTVDVETPGFEERLSLRAVLGAGQPARVRVGLARDPFAVFQETPDRAVPDDVTLTLWRGDALLETVAFASQTCYRSVEASCDAATGETTVVRAGPFECGRYAGTVPLTPGKVTVRAERDGLPTATATVTIPEPPAMRARAMGVSDDRAFFGFDLDDDAAPSRYGVSLRREYDRQTVSVCAVGGARDTTVAFAPRRYTTSFDTSDPVLLPAARDVDGSYQVVVFDDEAFAGRSASFTLDAARDGPARFGLTGRFAVQLAAVSPTLYGYLQETAFALDAETPFDEPANLPTNVEGGYGHVGAIAITEAVAE